MLTRFILLDLTKTRFKGTSGYLEKILARVDTPRLDELHITFFNQIIFDTPQLFQFISRRLVLRAPEKGHIVFKSKAIILITDIQLRSTQREDPMHAVRMAAFIP